MVNKILMILFVILFLVVIFLFSPNAKMEIQLLSTTDIHCNIMDYDYYRDMPTEEFGLVRTAFLIQKAREQFKNTLLFDNGDLIQGNPMANYIAKVQKLPTGTVHPVCKILNALKYDAAGLGNHEFNYGLEYLERVLSGMKFPYVCGNVYHASKTEKNNDSKEKPTEFLKTYFQPYTILERNFVANSGKSYPIKIGVLSVLPPQIMVWDTANLTGKVAVQDIEEAAKKWVPEMKKNGADIIVILAHCGIGPDTTKENMVYELCSIPDVNAIFAGHTHNNPFPANQYISGANLSRGTIKHTPVALADAYGKHLAGIELQIERSPIGKWHVREGRSWLRPLTTKEEIVKEIEVKEKDAIVKKTIKEFKITANTQPVAELVNLIKSEHESTLQYIRQSVGTTEIPLHTYLAQVYDNPCIELINKSQKWYMEQKVKELKLEQYPILSATAPFKCGGDPKNYVDIPAGNLTIKDIASLYPYDNTLYAVILNGNEIREYLEMSAGQFNQIYLHENYVQLLLNNSYYSFNFDIIDGVTYKIDITKTSRYDSQGYASYYYYDSEETKKRSRIVDLRYNEKPITKEDKFILVTNNYRANGGGNFPGYLKDKIVFSSLEEVREIVVDYIKTQKIIAPHPDNNWCLLPWPAGVQVILNTSPNLEKYLDSFPNIKFYKNLETGFSQYIIAPEPIKVEKKVEVEIKAPESTKVEERVKIEEPTKVEKPVKIEEPTKAEESVKIEEPAKTEEPVKIEEPAKTEEPVKVGEPTKVEDTESIKESTKS